MKHGSSGAQHLLSFMHCGLSSIRPPIAFSWHIKQPPDTMTFSQSDHNCKKVGLGRWGDQIFMYSGCWDGSLQNKKPYNLLPPWIEHCNLQGWPFFWKWLVCSHCDHPVKSWQIMTLDLRRWFSKHNCAPPMAPQTGAQPKSWQNRLCHSGDHSASTSSCQQNHVPKAPTKNCRLHCTRTWLQDQLEQSSQQRLDKDIPVFNLGG